MNHMATSDPLALHRVQLADVAPQPWRNGGGITRELLAWPQGDAWQLRATVASIERSGAFSAFPNVQRWFAVLQGAGVTLHLPGGAVTLRPGDAAVHFDGAAAPHCELVEGATLDLNLMVRDDAGSATLRAASPGDTLAHATRWRGLFCTEAATLAVDGVHHRACAGELLWSDSGNPASTWRVVAAARAWWLDLR